jgi:hypothetical protein
MDVTDRQPRVGRVVGHHRYRHCAAEHWAVGADPHQLTAGGHCVQLNHQPYVVHRVRIDETPGDALHAERVGFADVERLWVSLGCSRRRASLLILSPIVCCAMVRCNRNGYPRQSAQKRWNTNPDQFHKGFSCTMLSCRKQPHAALRNVGGNRLVTMSYRLVVACVTSATTSRSSVFVAGSMTRHSRSLSSARTRSSAAARPSMAPWQPFPQISGGLAVEAGRRDSGECAAIAPARSAPGPVGRGIAPVPARAGGRGG